MQCKLCGEKIVPCDCENEACGVLDCESCGAAFGSDGELIREPEPDDGGAS